MSDFDSFPPEAYSGRRHHLLGPYWHLPLRLIASELLDLKGNLSIKRNGQENVQNEEKEFESFEKWPIMVF